MKKELKELLNSDGKVLIPKSEVLLINKDGSVIIELPTSSQIVLKLSKIAITGKGMNTLKAIQMIMEQIDGKPKQTVSLKNREIPPRQIIDISDYNKK